jgi:hypothetical protein
MTYTNAFKVRLLTLSNYAVWRDEVEDLIVMKDLWDAVEENSSHATDIDEVAKSRKARSLLRMSTSEKLRGLIPRDGAAKQAWEALKTYGLARAAERKMELHRQLVSVRQDTCCDCSWLDQVRRSGKQRDPKYSDKYSQVCCTVSSCNGR